MKTKTRRIRWALAIPAALLLVALATTLVLADESSLLNGKLRAGDTVTVPASETVDGDLYAAAGTVTIDGAVNGDLIAVGGTIQVNGNVQGDVAIGGGTVSIFGPVGGDLRIGGGQVTVSGPVAEDVVIGGGQVTVAGGADVKGDLIVSGGTVTVAGNVAGSIEGTAGTYSRSGTVGGSEHVTVNPQSGGAVTPRTTGDIVFDAIRHFVVLVIIGALMLWLMPGLLRRAEQTLRHEPLLSLGGGVATFIGFVAFLIVAFLVMVLLAIVLGLAQLGSLVAVDVLATLLAIFTASFALFLAVAFVADIVVGLTLARMVMSDPAAGANRWRELGLLVVGAAVVVIVTSLPVIGGLAKLLVVVFGLGALAVAAWRWWRTPRTPDSVVAAPAVTPEAPASI
jgi:hypothetical protein